MPTNIADEFNDHSCFLFVCFGFLSTILVNKINKIIIIINFNVIIFLEQTREILKTFICQVLMINKCFLCLKLLLCCFSSLAEFLNVSYVLLFQKQHEHKTKRPRQRGVLSPPPPARPL